MEKVDPMFSVAIEEFPWDSDVQKEGYLAFIQYERKFGYRPKLPIDHVVAFFIQKDHESNEYWRDMVGDQFSGVTDQVRVLQEKILALEKSIDMLQSTVKTQALFLEQLSKKS